MTPKAVIVKVPATTANLGPAFDCLGMALDLWNSCTFTLTGSDLSVKVSGEGAGQLPTHSHNLMVRAFLEVYQRLGKPQPAGLQIRCENAIPLGSGLGSSAAAVLAGITAANVLAGEPFTSRDLLRIAAEFEGHTDNAAAALYGGLVAIFTGGQGELSVHKLDCAIKQLVIVLPDFKLPTTKARKVVPEQVPLHDVVYNIGHSIMVVEALRTGNYDSLLQAMEDTLHQPYRTALIPGSQAALQAARNLGAPAALTGAGPGIIAFPQTNPEVVIAAMQQAFSDAGLASRAWRLNTTYTGIHWEVI